jgi:preprotein translocase subunit SecY
MASSLSTNPFLTVSRTDSLSAFASPNSDLRSLSSVYLRPRFPKKLRKFSIYALIVWFFCLFYSWIEFFI